MEPTILTIPPDDEALPSGSRQMSVGQDICVYGKVTASDDQGLSFQPSSVEPMEGKDKGGEGEEEPAAGDTEEPESPSDTDSADDYVAGRRAKMSSMGA